MKRFIFKVSIYISFFIFLNLLISIRYNYIFENNLDSNLKREYLEKRENLQVVFVGGSEALDGINDDFFNSSLNLGSHGLSFEEEYLIIEQLIQDKIANIVLVISAPNFFRTNREPINTEIYYNSPWIDINFMERYLYDNSKLSKIFFKPRLVQFDCEGKSVDCFRRHAKKIGHFKKTDSNYGEKHYKNILKLFENNSSSQLHIVYMPVSPIYDSVADQSDRYNLYKNKVKSDSKKHKFKLYDLQKSLINHKTPYRFFKDTNHLNHRGRDTTSIILKENLILKP